MTELAQCSKCAELLNDADEDIAAHRRWHTQLEDSNEAVRRVASNASKDVVQLNAAFKDYQRPVTMPPLPQAVRIRVTDDDELQPDESDHVIDLDAEPVNTPDDPFATERAERNDLDAYRAEAYPAIDRDDDLDARLANATGTQPTI